MNNQDKDKANLVEEEKKKLNMDEVTDINKENDPEQIIEKLNTEIAELKDQVLRLAAEIENMRRRNTRDVQEARSYGITVFARDMLTVSDDLRRGLDSIPDKENAAKEPSFSALIEGIELTERTMLSALERHGVKKIHPIGEKFDPNFHQAMFETPNSEFPANTVMQVIQVGYSIGDRVLRPAMVGVSSGLPQNTDQGK